MSYYAEEMGHVNAPYRVAKEYQRYVKQKGAKGSQEVYQEVSTPDWPTDISGFVNISMSVLASGQALLLAPKIDSLLLDVMA